MYTTMMPDKQHTSVEKSLPPFFSMLFQDFYNKGGVGLRDACRKAFSLPNLLCHVEEQIHDGNRDHTGRSNAK